jgi:hypothetical protein
MKRREFIGLFGGAAAPSFRASSSGLTTAITSLARDGTMARLRDAPCSRNLKTTSMILSPLFCWTETLQAKRYRRWGYAIYQCKSPITLSQQDAPPCGVASWSLWFGLTLLFASLAGMATTIIAEERAGCGVVGMIELGAG